MSSKLRFARSQDGGMDFGPDISATNLYRRPTIPNLQQFSFQYAEINLGSEVDA
jgi:hypothetical protein